ncbi:MAG: hypothetical protein PHW52_04505 [Candidatus Pacebacteria bacterium]|nr:hypothetical protein [Candidatus Paceibacterota bacterium]
MKDHSQDKELERSIDSIRIKYTLISCSAIFLFLVFSFLFFKYSGFTFTLDRASSAANNTIINNFLIFGVFFLVVLGYLFEKVYNAESIFYNKFAKINDLRFRLEEEKKVGGILLGENDHVHLRDIISGKIGAHDYYFFNHSEKHEDIVTDRSILVIQLDFSIPKMIFVSDGFLVGDRACTYFDGNISSVPPDGDMSRRFFLACEKGFEIELLQVFSQEVQLFITSKYPDISLDFQGRQLMIYSDRLSTKKGLYGLFSFLAYLEEEIIPMLKSIESDYIDLKEAQKN